jgi:hypothetical protein
MTRREDVAMTRTKLFGALAMVFCAASAASAQVKPEQFGGAYALIGANGQKAGTVSVSIEADAVVLRTRLNDGTTRPELRLDRARSSSTKAVFAGEAPAAPSVGLDDIVASGGTATAPAASAGAARTLELTQDLRTVLKEGATVIARERLQRVRSILIVHASTYDPTHVNAFKAYATRLARRYKETMGYTTAESILGTSIDMVAARLVRAAEEAAPFDRLVFIGHGGWDGPVLGKYDEEGTHQASSHYNPEVFARLIDAIRRGTTHNAQIFSSSCHGGGNNVHERAKKMNGYIWSDDVAHQTGRTAAGPAGYTSTDYTEQHVFAVLEGQGTTKQEVRWASPKGVRSIPPGGTLAGTALRPVAPIVMPEPPVVTAAETPAEPVAATPVVNEPLGN